MIHDDIRKNEIRVMLATVKIQNRLFSLLSKNVKTKIYKTIILPVVLYWCETWSLTLERMGVFEKRVLMAIFGSR
jgi:hypothetical protein